jgi:hypothetical protein
MSFHISTTMQHLFATHQMWREVQHTSGVQHHIVHCSVVVVYCQTAVGTAVHTAFVSVERQTKVGEKRQKIQSRNNERGEGGGRTAASQ